MPISLNARKGVRKAGPVTELIVAANAGALAVYQQPTFAAMTGTKTLRLKRIKGINLSGADTTLHIGTGAAGAVVDAMPPLWIFDVLNFDFPEWDLPEIEVNGDLMAWAGAVPVTLQVEVELLG